MGIKSKLLKSIIILTVFYWSVTFIVFAFLPSSMMLRYAEKISINIDVVNLTVIDAYPILKRIIDSWVIPLLGIWIIIIAISFLLVLIGLLFKKGFENKRKKSSVNWRGLSTSITNIKEPVFFMDLRSSVKAGKLTLSEADLIFINDVCSLTMSFVGASKVADIEKKLFKGVSELSEKGVCVNLHIKIYVSLIYKTACIDSGHFLPQMDKALIDISRLNSWWKLPDRDIVLFAVRYFANKQQMPGSHPYLKREEIEFAEKAIDEFVLICEADNLELKGEDKKEPAPSYYNAVDDNNEADEVLDKIIHGLSFVPFHGNKNLSKHKPFAWYFEDKIFLIKEKLFELIDELYPDTDNLSEKIVDELKTYNCLISDFNNNTSDIWFIRAGKIDFAGVIVLNADSIHELGFNLPKLCPFPVNIIEPHKDKGIGIAKETTSPEIIEESILDEKNVFKMGFSD